MTKSRNDRPLSRGGKEGFLSRLSPTMLDLLCLLFLYFVTLALFRGIVFDNAAFAREGDTANAEGYVNAGNTLERTEGVDVLWMPYYFSGMPTFGNVAYIPHNVSYIQTAILTVVNLLFLNGKWTWLVSYYFIGGVFMFFLTRAWRCSRAAALLAALTFMLSPYMIGLAGGGHGSKLMALSYLPAMFLLTHLLFERRDFLSFGLLAAGVGTLMLTNHMQIVYYVFLAMGLYLLFEVIADARTRTTLAARRAALLVGALAVGFCISAYIYLSVYEYAQYSIRGGGTTGASGGLTWDYATNWSFNPWEILTLLVPSFFGFQTPYYWGTMPWQESTVYIGIVPLLFAALALVYRRTRVTMFFAILTVIVFLMSFGKHFAFFYELLFNYLPFFNKFRAPSMVLHLLPFTIGFLGAIGFMVVSETEEKTAQLNVDKLSRALLSIMGALGALLVIGFLFKSAIYDTLSGFMFVKADDMDQLRRQYADRAPQVLEQLKHIRFYGDEQKIPGLWGDFVKFVLIAAASLGCIVAFLKKKIALPVFTAGILGILLVDLFMMDGKFINPKPSSGLDQVLKADATTDFLQKQPGLYRIFPLPVGGSLWMDNTFPTHGIQSIGGYSPAKLKIYQTMIDSCMYEGTDPNFPLNMAIVNMLNGRFFLAQSRLPEDRFRLVNVDQVKRVLTYENPQALPRAFFVDSARIAHNDHEVFQALNDPRFNPARVAVLQDTLPGPIAKPDSASVAVTQYRARDITLHASTSSQALLVLSEVYYPAGWEARIDGRPVKILRTNYVLRSVVVPAGAHEVEFTFDPPVYRAGWTISNAAWGVAGLCILIGLWQLPAVRQKLTRRKPEEPRG